MRDGTTVYPDAMLVRIRSWHVVRYTSRTGGVRTLCGQWIAPPVTPEASFPYGEKTCESCLRLQAKGPRT